MVQGASLILLSLTATVIVAVVWLILSVVGVRPCLVKVRLAAAHRVWQGLILLVTTRAWMIFRLVPFCCMQSAPMGLVGV